MTIKTIILAGGQGRRLWPLSTQKRPKPFLKLGHGKTMLEQTVERARRWTLPYIIVSHDHHELLQKTVSLQQIDQVFLEPAGRSTAPAVAAAANFVAQTAGLGPDTLLLVMPSDHEIKDVKAFQDAVEKAADVAQDGALVTFGIRPRGASPHYGYICRGAAQGEGFKIDHFVEKPPRTEAKQYIKTGSYYWNSGIFLFSARAYLAVLQEFQADIAEKSYQAVARAARRQNMVILEKEAFSACPALSIDYAVMEQAKNRYVMPVTMGWHDIGTWPSLLRHLLLK